MPTHSTTAQKAAGTSCQAGETIAPPTTGLNGMKCIPNKAALRHMLSAAASPLAEHGGPSLLISSGDE
jgi:hypothetical protein